MASRVRRNNVWFVVLFMLMIFGGFCAIGFWQSFDIKCNAGGTGKVWVWTKFPPHYECPLF